MSRSGCWEPQATLGYTFLESPLPRTVGGAAAQQVYAEGRHVFGHACRGRGFSPGVPPPRPACRAAALVSASGYPVFLTQIGAT